jgi:hypothetical protein
MSTLVVCPSAPPPFLSKVSYIAKEKPTKNEIEIREIDWVILIYLRKVVIEGMACQLPSS